MRGSTSVTVNAAGASTSTINYQPFGATRASSGILPTDKKFTGQRQDSTGLYYYNARYYDPKIGRFIMIIGGIAVYVVLNNYYHQPANTREFNKSIDIGINNFKQNWSSVYNTGKGWFTVKDRYTPDFGSPVQ